MRNINVSIVVYHNNEEQVLRTIKSCLNSNLNMKIYLIDNSSNQNLSKLVSIDKKKIIYIFNNSNLGHGKAHNIALKKSIQEKVKYHLVLNPDVYFEKGVLEELYNFMEKNHDVGMVMPKIIYPDGSIQYLCKLLPTPLDLFGRRFLSWGPFKDWIKKRNEHFELRFTNYDVPMDVPFLSGCFMFIRTKVLEKVGLFDERFFLYCDDLDLSRRIHKVSRTVYYPYCRVFHEWRRGSYKSVKLLWYHIKDSIKYFNKWGWFVDHERDIINKETLYRLETRNEGFKADFNLL
jgi:GT2 family glycosyltransferase